MVDMQRDLPMTTTTRITCKITPRLWLTIQIWISGGAYGIFLDSTTTINVRKKPWQTEERRQIHQSLSIELIRLRKEVTWTTHTITEGKDPVLSLIKSDSARQLTSKIPRHFHPSLTIEILLTVIWITGWIRWKSNSKISRTYFTLETSN